MRQKQGSILGVEGLIRQRLKLDGKGDGPIERR
jgi:hypothetical protein